MLSFTLRFINETQKSFWQKLISIYFDHVLFNDATDSSDYAALGGDISDKYE